MTGASGELWAKGAESSFQGVHVVKFSFTGDSPLWVGSRQYLPYQPGTARPTWLVRQLVACGGCRNLTARVPVRARARVRVCAPRLLSKPPWSSSLEAVAQALAAAAKALGSRAQPAGALGTAQQQQPEEDGCWRACLAALVALRDALPGHAYDAVAAAFPWQALAGMQ